VPEINPWLPKKGTQQRPHQLLDHLFAEESSRERAVATFGEVTLGSLREQKHWLKRLIGHAKQFTAEVIGEAAESTVDMPKLLKVNDNLWSMVP